MALAFVSGISLTAASQWFRPVQQGEAALAAGQFESARAALAIAQARFERFPVATRLSPEASVASESNQILALYELGQHDAILERAGAAQPGSPAHFWAGCVLFGRAAAEAEKNSSEKSPPEKTKEVRIGLLTGASAEFRLALAANPGDWDTKYNYELTERLLAQLRDPPKKPPKQQLQLLRPESRSGRPPSKPIG